jgi:hypothetical protein
MEELETVEVAHPELPGERIIVNASDADRFAAAAVEAVPSGKPARKRKAKEPEPELEQTDLLSTPTELDEGELQPDEPGEVDQEEEPELEEPELEEPEPAPTAKRRRKQA